MKTDYFKLLILLLLSIVWETSLAQSKDSLKGKQPQYQTFDSIYCHLTQLPSIPYGRKARISSDAKKTLSFVIKELNENPCCKVHVKCKTGYCGSPKLSELAGDMGNVIKAYLVKNNIAPERVIVVLVNIAGNSSDSMIDLEPTDDSHNLMTVPHPNLKRR